MKWELLYSDNIFSYNIHLHSVSYLQKSCQVCIRILMRQPFILILLYDINEGWLELEIIIIDQLMPNPRIIIINNGSKIVS